MSLFQREKPKLSENDQNRFMTRKEFVELKRKQRAVDIASCDYDNENIKDHVHAPNSTIIKL